MTQQPSNWLDESMGGYSVIQDDSGNPIPQRNILQIIGYETLVDDAGNLRSVLTIPSGATPTYPLVGPSIEGETVFLPATSAPATYASVDSEIFTGQTTSGAHTNIVLATIPLPGTSGAPCTEGQIDLDVEISMKSTTTTDAARFKLSWSWSVDTPGSPVALGTLVSSLSIGTNSGSAPSGWSATIALDGGSQNALVKVTGDSTLNVNVRVLAQWSYLE